MPKKPAKRGAKAPSAKQPPARAALPSDHHFPDDFVLAISDAVYRERLGPKGVANTLAQPQGEATLRARAIAYNSITRAYLRVLQTKGLLK